MVLLEKVQELPQYHRINFRVKVMHIEDVIELRRGEKVRIVIKSQMPIGKSNLVGALKEGCSFEISDLMVKDYCGSKRLSTAKNAVPRKLMTLGI